MATDVGDQPVEKEWGPNFLRFDLGLAANEGGDMFAILRVDHDRTWVNSLGGHWHNARNSAGKPS